MSDNKKYYFNEIYINKDKLILLCNSEKIIQIDTINQNDNISEIDIENTSYQN